MKARNSQNVIPFFSFLFQFLCFSSKWHIKLTCCWPKTPNACDFFQIPGSESRTAAPQWHKPASPPLCKSLSGHPAPRLGLSTLQDTDRKTTHQPRGSHSSLTVTHNFCCSLIRAWSILICKSSHIHLNRPPQDSLALEALYIRNSFQMAEPLLTFYPPSSLICVHKKV